MALSRKFRWSLSRRFDLAGGDDTDKQDEDDVWQLSVLLDGDALSDAEEDEKEDDDDRRFTPPVVEQIPLPPPVPPLLSMVSVAAASIFVWCCCWWWCCEISPPVKSINRSQSHTQSLHCQTSLFPSPCLFVIVCFVLFCFSLSLSLSILSPSWTLGSPPFLTGCSSGTLTNSCIQPHRQERRAVPQSVIWFSRLAIVGQKQTHVFLHLLLAWCAIRLDITRGTILYNTVRRKIHPASRYAKLDRQENLPSIMTVSRLGPGLWPSNLPVPRSTSTFYPCLVLR